MASRRRSFLQAILVVLVLGVLATCVIGLLVVWLTRGADIADPVASILGVVLSAAVAVGALIGWLRRQREVARLPPTAERIDLAAATLAGVVREQWIREVDARDLHDDRAMPVRWRLSNPDLMDDPENVLATPADEVEGRSDDVAQLAAAFRGLRRRRLVITGGPGTGKTTLAVQLLVALLPRSDEVSATPVPVLFSLLSWDPDVHPRLPQWVAAQLEVTYPVLRSIAPAAPASLAEQNRVLPILDGLDEVAPERRAHILRALNAAPSTALIMTSRRPEYRTAVADGGVLNGAAVIAPIALTPREARSHLARRTPRNDAGWAAVLAALDRSDRRSPLAEIVGTPLGLWLVRAVYVDGRRDPRPLVDGTHRTTAELRAHLLDELVPAVVGGPDPPDGRTRLPPPDHVRRWLTTLARQLDEASSRDWRWWEVAGMTFVGRGRRWSAVAWCGLAAGLLFALLAVLSPRPLAVLAVAGFVALVGSLYARLTLRSADRARPPGRLRTAWRGQGAAAAIVRGSARGAAVGVGSLMLLIVLPLTVMGAIDLGTVFRTAIGGLGLGAPIGATISLVRFATGSRTAPEAATPVRSYRDDRSCAVTTVLGVIAVSGIPGAVLLAAIQHPGGFGLVFYGVLAGLGIVAVRRPWPAAVLAFSWWALHRRLPPPWRLMKFLESCHRSGLLRAVGPVYQFRHAELQDHLAGANPPPR